MNKMRFLIPTYMMFAFMLSTNLLFSENLPFNYERLMVNFKGVAFNQTSILCYGDGGIILRSSDRGNKWEQIKAAPDVYTIRKMLFIGSNYFGILDSNYIIFSKNDGLNWTLHSIENEHSYSDFDADSSNIYFLGHNKINVKDFDLNTFKEIDIDTSWNAKSISILNNRAILASDSSRLVFVDLSGSNSSKVVDLYPLMLNKKLELPSQIKLYNNNIYVRISNEIFKSFDLGNTWTRVLENSGIIEPNDNHIFSIKSTIDKIKNISYLEFYQSDSSRFKRINYNSNTRYITSQNYYDFKFLSRDTLIAVGDDKLINMSYDGGKTWTLKCNLRSVNFCFSRWVDDSLGYFFTDKYQISKTTNGGVTWLPQNYNYKSKGVYEFSVPDAWYLDKEGTVIQFRRTMLRGSENFLLSNDFGENYFTLIDSSVDGYIADLYRPTIIKKDTSYLLFYCIEGSKLTSTMIAELSNNLSVMNKNYLDSISLIYVKKTENKDELMAIGIEKRYPNDSKGFDSISFYIMYSYDYGKSWNKDFKFQINEQSIPEVSSIDNYIFFYGYSEDSNNPDHYITSLDILDFKEKKFYRHAFRNSIFLSTFFKLDKSIYGTNSSKDLIVNSDIAKNPYGWQLDLNSKFQSITSNFSNGKIAYCVAGYDYSKSYLYKFTPLITEDVEEVKINSSVYFYPMKPYPLPSSNFISCHIFTSMDFNSENTDIAIYDISGKKVAVKAEINMSRFSSWEWDLKWDCSRELNGIYLIVLKEVNSVFSIPVVVQR